ncbi:MAG: TlpA disulfide reductase family protein [Bacteroidia bacterium]|nr:AhpC/TSA family protein [Bacteroidia bacterium]MDW8015349.1 TlpA disulfide reductase family protein [Bacteroidia bacterium]
MYLRIRIRSRWGLVLLLSSACQSQPAFLTGEIKGFLRDSLYLYRWVDGRWEKVASTKVEGERFSFRGSILPGIYLWGLSPQEGDIVILGQKEAPHIKGEGTRLFQTYLYEKSPDNEKLLQLRREVSNLYQRLNQLPQEQRVSLQRAMDSLFQAALKSSSPHLQMYGYLLRPPTPLTFSQGAPSLLWKELDKSFWSGFRWDSVLAPQIPETFVRMQSFWQNALSLIPEDSLWRLSEGWIEKLPSSLRPTAWIALVDAAQRYQLTETMLFAAEHFLAVAPQDPRRAQLEQFIQAEGALRRGQVAPDIALPDPTGKIRRLSELRGKWVLIDFWASWCRPCRMENPRVVRLYQQYRPRGFEIFGVSLDYNREAWLGAIQADNLMWTHVSDLKGWQSAGAQLYRVSGIPYTVLIDPQGRIVAKGLRGASLEAKLQELFP